MSVGWILVVVGVALVAVAVVIVLGSRGSKSSPVVSSPAQQIRRTHALPPPPLKTMVIEPEERTSFAKAPLGFAAWFHIETPQAKTLPLHRTGVTTVGKHDCHILLNEPGVRPRHFKVITRERECVLIALPDDQTVEVDGKEESSCVLHDGSAIRVGQVSMRFKVT